jgi:hypothetical protein
MYVSSIIAVHFKSIDYYSVLAEYILLLTSTSV